MIERARVVIRDLGLVPHPEGGYYREIFRSTSPVITPDGRGQRTAATSIYFLLVAGTHSRWHRVTSDEVWHFYEGEPLELLMTSPDIATTHRVRLALPGPDAEPSATVPAGWWQAARPLGAYALAGCTVAPGFEFQDFSFLGDDAGAAGKLAAARPEWTALL